MDITVAICTFNNAAMLDCALEALAQQQTPHDLRWSVLVVDNNCTDDTPHVIARWQQSGRLSNLSMVCESNQGLSHSRRRAILASESHLIAFVDDDMLLDCNWVANAADFMAHHPDAGALGGRVVLRWEREPDALIAQYARSFAAQDHGDAPALLPTPVSAALVGAGLVLQREAIERCGWLDRAGSRSALVGRKGGKLTAGDDSELVFRVRNAGYETWYSPELRAEHMIGAQRMSVDYICRLHRGFGQCAPVLDVLRRNIRPSLRFRARGLWRSAKQCAAMFADIARHDLSRLRRPHETRRIALHRAWGQLEGSLRLLWTGGRFV